MQMIEQDMLCSVYSQDGGSFFRKLTPTICGAALARLEWGEKSAIDRIGWLFWKGWGVIIYGHVDPLVEAAVPSQSAVGSAGHFFEILLTHFSDGDSGRPEAGDFMERFAGEVCCGGISTGNK